MILRAGIIIILQILLLSCNRHYVKQKQEFKHYSFNGKAEKRAEQDSISKYKLKIDAETGRVIGISTGELTKDGAECTLGNFLCDAMLYVAKKEMQTENVDIVIVNRGGLRANLPKGELKVVNAFELMPFENELVLVTVKGEKLEEFLPLLLEKKHPFLGCKVKMENNKISSFLINGFPIDKSKNYSILTSDYLATGGDNFNFLKEPVSIKYYSVKIRDAVIKYCDGLTAEKRQIIPYTDGRLEISK